LGLIKHAPRICRGRILRLKYWEKTPTYTRSYTVRIKIRTNLQSYNICYKNKNDNEESYNNKTRS